MWLQVFDRRVLRPVLKLCALLLLTLASSGIASAAICRVTTSGSSGNAGSAWGLPMALQTALANPGCTEIWVKAGVYTPGSARTDSFAISPGVAVYGGFAGTETSRGDRNAVANVTILSGDIDQNDTNNDGNFIDETATDIQGNNSLHVVTVGGPNGNVTNADTILDGFTITGGEANGSGFLQSYGGGLYCNGENANKTCNPTLGNVTFSGNSASHGGAMFNDGYSGISKPTLNNVVFSGNSATYGGAMYSDGEYGGNGSPILHNVTFIGNSATQWGGAMFNDGYAGLSNPALSNVTFSGNNAAIYGGAMFNNGSASGASSPTVSNSTFSGNSAYGGGAMFNFGDSGMSSPILINVTFNGNSAAGYGGALSNDGENAGHSSPILKNVILWGDTGMAPTSEINNDGNNGGTANPTIDHSVVQGGCPPGSSCTAVLTADPLLGALGNNGGSTATLLLGTASSALDAGDDTICAATPVNGLDQRGVTRPQASHCDIGAVEMEAITDRIFADGFEQK